MSKISIIVPVYNAELYLKRCIESLINQTYRNIELIIVNDGSTDNSGKICDEYKQKDKRISVIHTENGGQSKARNIGLDMASGKYVAFVDSDDWVAEDIYEHVIDIAERTNCDVVDFKCIFTDHYIKINKSNINNTHVVEGKDILRDYLLRGQTEQAPFSPCRKLYRYNLFDKIRFPEGKINEDISTNYKILMECNKLIHTDKIGYYYFQNSLSTTRRGFVQKDFDLLDACKELERLSRDEECKEIQQLIKVKHARSYFSLLAKIAFYGISDENVDRKEVVKYLTRNLRENYKLLMKSPMPLNRKLMVTVVCIDIRFLSLPLIIYKKIKSRFM